MATTPVVRPISRFEFARMWGGVDFSPELKQRVLNAWNRDPGLDEEEREEIMLWFLAYWAGGDVFELIYGERTH